ncbi:hypothetical protein MMC20_004167 [Loxospora ochrophaea]|nr:hypothetical protein [Loxospora ochrophaea]
MTSPNPTFASPKRKRSPHENEYALKLSPSTSRIRTDVPAHAVQLGRDVGSPKTVMVGQLQALNLDPKSDGQVSISKYDMRGAAGECDGQTIPQLQTTPDMSELGNKDRTETPPEKFTSATGDSSVDSPARQDLTTTSTAPPLQKPPSAQLTPPKPAPPITQPPFPSPSNRPRPRSPPPPTPLPPSQDSNDDDGYGINGIGYRPSPAQAWARAQRRRQQVAEWKSRENREARARRSERRWKGGMGGNATGAEGKGSMGSEEEGRRVRFVED